MSVVDFWLPILLSGLATHIYSTLAWIVLPHHKPDWNKLPVEDEFQQLIAANSVPAGQYLVPYAEHPNDQQSEVDQQKQGKCVGTVILWSGPVNMGVAIAKTLSYFFVVALAIAHLCTLALRPGTEPLKVFEFVVVSSLLAHVAGQFPGVFWFRQRVTMDTVDKILFAVITAAIFAALWPAA